MPQSDSGRATGSAVAVSLLGPVGLHVGDEAVPITAKQAAVLAMLALDPGRVISVDRLIDGCWGDDAPRTVRTSLQVQVSQLRQAIAKRVAVDVIVTRPPGYLLDVDAPAVDALRFGQLVAQSRRCVAEGDVERGAGLADEGLRLWHGDALTGLGDAPFAGPVATRFADQRLDLVEVWADAEISNGHAESVIAPLEAWVGQFPYRETLWQRLILALYRGGRQVDALARLADLRKMLRDEIGVRPGAAIVELETAILDHDATLDSAPASQMPARLSGPGRRLPASKALVGRDELVAAVADRCGAAKLVTLVGPGGVGKTSVAVNVAAAMADAHADGVWFVDLSAVAEGTLVVSAVGAALGLHPGDGGLLIDAVVELLRDADLLLVLDNCEHVVGHAAEIVDRIVRACPGVRILATSREGLAIPDEAIVTVQALEPDDAASLLRQLARRSGATIATEDSSAAILCASVDRLPLGIELVAARLQSMAAADIVSQLDADRLLQLGSRTVNERHRSLNNTVQWSYDLLADTSRTLLRRFGVFEGGATLDAILTVCADPNGAIGGDPMIDVLDTLVRVSLVTVDRTQRHPRYRLLETVKAFALGRLEEPDRSETRRRHAEEMIEWGRRMRLIGNGPDPAAAFSAIQTEAANLRAAFSFCASSGDFVNLSKLIGAPGPLLWRESGAIHELDEWIDIALSADAAPPADRLSVLLVAAFRSGRPTPVERVLGGEALELATTLGDEPLAAFAEFVLGDVTHDEAGPGAEALLRSAIARLEAAHCWREAGHAVSTCANLLLRQRRLDEAAALLRPRLRSHEAYGASEAYLIYQHARLLVMTGDVEGADAGFDAAMRNGVCCGAPLAIGWAWFGKAWVAEASHDLAAARDCLERSLVIDLQCGDRRDHLGDRIRLVMLSVRLGDLTAAREHSGYIAELIARNPEPREIGLRAHANGVIALADGDAATSRRFLLEALDSFASTAMIDYAADVLDSIVRTLPDPQAGRLRALPNDVRELRVSPADAAAIIRRAT